nr:MAG TPA: hypothetical protein [Caudoviricetes sp.]
MRAQDPFLVLLHSHDGMISPFQGWPESRHRAARGPEGGGRNLFGRGRHTRGLCDWRGIFSESGTEFLRNTTQLLLKR